MRLHYPIGTQYADVIGKGSLAGMADEILNMEVRHLEMVDREVAEKKAGRAAARKVRENKRDRPDKKMTLAMQDIIKYIKKHPGTRRADLLNVYLGGKCNVSTSSLGDNLSALVRQGFLHTNGLTQNRRYFITEKGD